MKGPGLWDLAKAAFSARPLGMPVPPNWIALAAVGLIGLVEPAAWFIGAALEIAYLAIMVQQPWLQAQVLASGRPPPPVQESWRARLDQELARLAGDDAARYHALAERCRTILARQAGGDQLALQAQAEGLNRLVWIYLRLLGTRRNLMAIADADGEERARLEAKAAGLEQQLAREGLDQELGRSLQGQLEIVRTRVQKRAEATQKLAYLEAELQRIEEQVELIREQAALASDALTVSHRIDAVASTLGSTTEWLREQQQLVGNLDELLASTPPLLDDAPPHQRATEKPS